MGKRHSGPTGGTTTSRQARARLALGPCTPASLPPHHTPARVLCLIWPGRPADGMVWVVDSADVRRLEDCRAELHTLLGEEKARAHMAAPTRRCHALL